MSGTNSGHAEREARPAEARRGGAKARVEADERPSEELLREAWAGLFELMSGHMRNFPTLAAEFELSPVQAHVLKQLGEGPLAMSTLANYLSCDASNVTGLVDRMEARGLVERRSSEQDRRVKMLVLTEAGGALRERLMAKLAEPPKTIAALSVEDLRALRDILQRALHPQ